MLPEAPHALQSTTGLGKVTLPEKYRKIVLKGAGGSGPEKAESAADHPTFARKLPMRRKSFGRPTKKSIEEEGKPSTQEEIPQVSTGGLVGGAVIEKRTSANLPSSAAKRRAAAEAQAVGTPASTEEKRTTPGAGTGAIAKPAAVPERLNERRKMLARSRKIKTSAPRKSNKEIFGSMSDSESDTSDDMGEVEAAWETAIMEAGFVASGDAEEKTAPASTVQDSADADESKAVENKEDDEAIGIANRAGDREVYFPSLGSVSLPPLPYDPRYKNPENEAARRRSENKKDCTIC